MSHQGHAIGIIDQRISGNTCLFLVSFTETAVDDQQLTAAAYRGFAFCQAYRHMPIDNMRIFLI